MYILYFCIGLKRKKMCNAEPPHTSWKITKVPNSLICKRAFANIEMWERWLSKFYDPTHVTDEPSFAPCVDG